MVKKTIEKLNNLPEQLKSIYLTHFRQLLSEKSVSVHKEVGGFWPILFVFIIALSIAFINTWSQDSLAGIEKDVRIIGGPNQPINTQQFSSFNSNPMVSSESQQLIWQSKGISTEISDSFNTTNKSLVQSDYIFNQNSLSNQNSPITIFQQEEQINLSKIKTKLSKEKLPYYPNYYLIPTTGINWGQIHSQNAVDIANRCNTTVIASAEGLILETGFLDDYGNYIKIQHPNNTQTLYAHLSEILVESGDYADRGQIIGAMGNTGRSTGCHLHFEVRGAINPFGR